MVTKTTEISMQQRLLGGIYGHLLGDAFGVPYEFILPSRLPTELTWRSGGAHGKPSGTWSDDGAMMLCQLASIAEKRTIDIEDTSLRFCRWLRDGYMTTDGDTFDIGNTTEMALRRLENGSTADESGGSAEGDNGNGSLMRILPVGLWHAFAGDPASLRIQTFAVSAITHGHLRSKLVCLLHNLVVKELVAGASRKNAIKSALRELQLFDDNTYPKDIVREELHVITSYSDRTGSGYVVDSWWSAWDAFLRSTTFESTIKNAVGFGNDTDTTAAIAGGLAGVFYGQSGLPKDWLADLKMTDLAAASIHGFVDLVSANPHNL